MIPLAIRKESFIIVDTSRIFYSHAYPDSFLTHFPIRSTMRSAISFRSLIGRFFHSRFPKNTKDNPESDIWILDDAEGDYRDGTFLNSVEQLTEEDVPLSPAAVKKKRTAAEWVRLFVFYASAAAFCVSCYMLIENLLYRQKASEIYTQLENDFFSEGFQFESAFSGKGDDTVLSQDSEMYSLTSMSENIRKLEAGEAIDVPVSGKKKNKELEKMRASLQALAKKNPDTYGWISVADTNINYPIVQGKDNDYYLEHAYTGDYLPIGSIYADYRCNTSIMRNYNTVFYGHNITSGAMFHDVTKFFEDYYFDNVRIYIYTFEGVYIYEPFAIYETRYDSNYIRTGFTSFEDFKAFTDKIKGDATKVRDVEITESDRIITLSTCTNGAATARYALHAKLVDYIVD